MEEDMEEESQLPTLQQLTCYVCKNETRLVRSAKAAGTDISATVLPVSPAWAWVANGW